MQTTAPTAPESGGSPFGSGAALLDRATTVLAGSVDELLTVAVSPCSTSELTAVFDQVVVQRRRLDAAHLRLLRELDVRKVADGAAGTKDTGDWLHRRHRVSRPQARNDVKAAAALAGSLDHDPRGRDTDGVDPHDRDTDGPAGGTAAEEAASAADPATAADATPGTASEPDAATPPDAPGDGDGDGAEGVAVPVGMPELYRVGRALAAGKVSREHVEVARRAMDRVPARFRGEHRATIAEFLSSTALRYAPADCDTLARQILAALDPDGSDSYDPDAFDRRRLTATTDTTGTLLLRGQLDPAAAAIVQAALLHFANPTRTDTRRTTDGCPGAATCQASGCEHAGGGDQAGRLLPPVRDTRTGAQRTADGLVQMARLALGAAAAGTRGGEPPRVTIHATPDQLHPHSHSDGDGGSGRHSDSDEDCVNTGHGTGCGDRTGRESGDAFGLAAATAAADAAAGRGCAPRRGAGLATCEQTGPLHPGTLARLVCDATLEVATRTPSGVVLNLGFAVRAATPAQRRALAARDRGCAFPACDAPPGWTDAHHIRWWTRDGPTDLDNLVLLCGAHHTEIHTERWTITVRDRLPWFVPPFHVDTTRTPTRNTMHHDIGAARHLATQLSLGLTA